MFVSGILCSFIGKLTSTKHGWEAGLAMISELRIVSKLLDIVKLDINDSSSSGGPVVSVFGHR